MILYIVPKITHESGKQIQLICWWHRDRLIVKDMDAPGYEGLHFFPNDAKIGGTSNTCPTIDLVTVRKDGQGWDIEGETSEGKKFMLEITHDFVKNCSAFSPIYLVE